MQLLQQNNKLSKEEKCEILLHYIAYELLVVPWYFDDIFKYFSTELPKLLSAALFFKSSEYDSSRNIYNSVLLSKIVNKRTDFKGYALKYFSLYPSPFDSDVKDSSKKCKKKDDFRITDLEIIESCYLLLKSNPDFYRNKWNWSKFINKYLHHSDTKIKWVACSTLGILLGMNEATLEKLIHTKILPDMSKQYSCIFNIKSTLAVYNSSSPPLDQRPVMPGSKKFADQVTNISGIYIPIINDVNNISENMLVEVTSTYNNLRKIALGLTSNKAICLQGPVGSGKTSLVEYLALRTGRKLGENFIKVQLGDQTDSKMLLGTYRCTDIPGEFIWQPGVLTQAVVEGNWLLLEDIDSASIDIASVVTSLLENHSLTVPGYRDSVAVTPGFQLFVTQRFVSTVTGHHKRHSNAVTLLEKHLLQITIDPLTTADLKQILDKSYSAFYTITDRMINVFLLFSQTPSDTTTSYPRHSRLISTRDFFKWCARSIINFDIKSQASALKVLQDAIDVFCCSFANGEEALNLAKQISTHLGIINQKADYFFTTYKPNMKLTSDSLIVGRAVLKRENSGG
ncbi:hypothetical protein NQ318_016495 [Aromia moschata]|uniref:AAA+ ATPase domain-containing protein n=1 Tax=Aromia moschata TaxID=1265417 RepID=A0AAV8X5R5_9CUCU|nr:hypothetical protein NQ318_016495 [Aromia moschata]